MDIEALEARIKTRLERLVLREVLAVSKKGDIEINFDPQLSLTRIHYGDPEIKLSAVFTMRNIDPEGGVALQKQITRLTTALTSFLHDSGENPHPERWDDITAVDFLKRHSREQLMRWPLVGDKNLALLQTALANTGFHADKLKKPTKK